MVVLRQVKQHNFSELCLFVSVIFIQVRTTDNSKVFEAQGCSLLVSNICWSFENGRNLACTFSQALEISNEEHMEEFCH